MDDWGEKSVVTPIIKLAFRCNRTLYPYLHPHPYSVHEAPDGTLKLTVTRWSLKIIPWYIFFLNIILAILLCWFLSFGYMLGIHLGEPMEFYKFIVTTVFAIAGFAQVIIVMIAMLNPELGLVFNQLIVLEKRCILRNGPVAPILRQREHLGKLQLLIVFGCAMFASVCVFGAVLMELDPFYYLFEEFFPSHYERSLSVIIWSFCVRYFITYACVAEGTRTCILIIMVLVLALLVSFSVVQNVKVMEPSQLVNKRDSVGYYEQLRIIQLLSYVVINSVVGILVVVAYLSVIIAAWLAIECWGHVSVLICFIAGIMAVLVAVTALLILTIVARIEIETNQLIERKMHSFRFAKHHTSRSTPKYRFLRWKCQKYIAVKCGPLFQFREEILKKYFVHLVDNLVDAVLLINPF